MIAQIYNITSTDSNGKENICLPGQMALIFERDRFQAGANTHLSIYNAMYNMHTNMAGRPEFEWYAAHYTGPISQASAQIDTAASVGNNCGCCRYTFSGLTPGIFVDRRRSGFVSAMDPRSILLRSFTRIHSFARRSITTQGLNSNSSAIGNQEIREWRPVIMAEVPDCYTGPTIQLFDIVEKRMVNVVHTPIPFVFTSVLNLHFIKKLGLDRAQYAMEEYYRMVLAYLSSIASTKLYIWHQEDATMLQFIESPVQQETCYTVQEAKQMVMRAVAGVTNGSIADPNMSSIFRWVAVRGDRNDVFKDIDLEARHAFEESLGAGMLRMHDSDAFLD